MNPRILKKLCKRIVEMQHPVAKGAWIDTEDTIGYCYIGSHLWGEKKLNATANQKRSHYMTKTSIKKIYVVGGVADYWGEAIDPEPVFCGGIDYVLWRIGKRPIEQVFNSAGEVIEEIDGWPETNRRLTGQFVIKFLREEAANKHGK